jgi:hypothetical protein
MANVGTSIVVTMFYATGNGTTTLDISNVTFSHITSTNASAAGQLLCAATAPCSLTFLDVEHVDPASPKSGWQCQDAEGSATDVSPPLTCLSPGA